MKLNIYDNIGDDSIKHPFADIDENIYNLNELLDQIKIKKSAAGKRVFKGTKNDIIDTISFILEKAPNVNIEELIINPDENVARQNIIGLQIFDVVKLSSVKAFRRNYHPAAD
jgi:hypothetical protein